MKPVVLCNLGCSNQWFCAALLISREGCVFHIAPECSAKGCGEIRSQVPTSVTYLGGFNGATQV